jgi:hypothetical protein
MTGDDVDWLSREDGESSIDERQLSRVLGGMDIDDELEDDEDDFEDEDDDEDDDEDEALGALIVLVLVCSPRVHYYTRVGFLCHNATISSKIPVASNQRQ